MLLIERGSGAPIVFIPGIQGRWQFSRPTIDALAQQFHVVTFPLCDEPSAACPFDASRPMDGYVDQVRAALDSVGHARAVVLGLSFGGLIALRFAAEHSDRASALILASTPGPGTRLRPRHEQYLRHPRLFGPLFLIETPFRLRAEVKAALPDRAARWAFARRMLATPFTARLSPTRMAARARLIGSYDSAADCARIAAPTLVITGRAGLDHVVAPDGTSQYARLIPGAELAVLDKTGHVGSLTRPAAFAALVGDFVRRVRHAAA
jgi:pimeloyl-ACP methyl ester carboxylesterase